MFDYLDGIPSDARLAVARLAREVIERAASLGPRRWGATPYDDGIRINVGWTEILTAWSNHLCLVVDGSPFVNASLPLGVKKTRGGSGSRGFYPSVPGSIRVEIPYHPLSRFKRTAQKLGPSLMSAVELAGRRRAGRGVKEGHRQAVVQEIAALTGAALPSPGYAPSVRTVDTQLVRMEGALREVTASRHERNAAARLACVEHFGTSCLVCGFSFEDAFGDLGRGFIHVHHVVPLSARGRAYRVDPKRDLIPVCPNCHAMFHQETPPFSLTDLKARLRRTGA
jgi:hypothetical protein